VIALAFTAALTATDISALRLRDYPWGLHVQQAPAPNGFSFRHTEREHTIAWSGYIERQEAVLVYAYTPKSKSIYEMTLILGKEADFPQACQYYNKYKQMLTVNYGKPSHSYNFTYLPFSKGIGYDNLAMRQGKYNISDFWAKFKDTFIGMAITPEGWTCITFESKKFSPIATKEANASP